MYLRFFHNPQLTSHWIRRYQLVSASTTDTIDGCKQPKKTILVQATFIWLREIDEGRTFTAADNNHKTGRGFVF